MFDDLARDLARYNPGDRPSVLGALMYGGAWASVSYRFSRWARRPGPLSWARAPLRLLATCLHVVVRAITHVELPWNAQIGPGLYFPHPGFVTVAGGAVIGENCTLAPGVVLGHALGGRHSESGAPRLGDRVYLGPGSIVIGPVTIGDDALVGVGAVVTRSVPDRGVAAGNPARIVACTGSFELLTYPGAERDAARQASLAKVADSVSPGEP